MKSLSSIHRSCFMEGSRTGFGFH